MVSAKKSGRLLKLDEVAVHSFFFLGESFDGTLGLFPFPSPHEHMIGEDMKNRPESRTCLAVGEGPRQAGA